MNKVLIVGRLVRDPETNQTSSGIKYSRFTIAVSRPYGDNETDFIPVVAWRGQAEFMENYMRKGALMSVDGRFTSSTYKNASDQTVTRYEVTADRVQSLESKAQAQARGNGVPASAAATQTVQFEESPKEDNSNTNDVPWEMEL